MGFNDFMKKAADKTTELVKAEFDKQSEIKRRQAEQAEMIRASFQINTGFQLVNASSFSTMFQRKDGTIYFNDNYDDRYVLVDYQWSGPRFEVTTSSTTNTHGNEVTKGKMGKMTAGAIIGTLVVPVPGVGTAVGAAIGAGGKKKKSKQEQKVTHSVQSQVELLTPATLKLRNIDTGEIASLVVGCNTLIDSQIKSFQIQVEQAVTDISDDVTAALQGIKSLKELLDMGAITQEEYDNKKAQLLNK